MGINHVVFFKGIFLSHMPANFTDKLSIWPYRNCVYFTVNRNDIVCIVYAVHEIITRFRLRFTVFNATFNNISVISWRSVLFLEEIGVLGKKTHWPVESHWQTFSYYVVSSNNNSKTKKSNKQKNQIKQKTKLQKTTTKKKQNKTKQQTKKGEKREKEIHVDIFYLMDFD